MCRQGHLPLQSAVRLGQYSAAHVLLDACANARALEPYAHTSVLGSFEQRSYSYCSGSDLSDADNFAASATPLLRRLLQAGADPLAPQHRPVLLAMSWKPLSIACTAWLWRRTTAGSAC